MKNLRPRSASVNQRCRDGTIMGVVTVFLALCTATAVGAGESAEWSGLTFLERSLGGALRVESDARDQKALTILDGFAQSRKGALFIGKARLDTVFFTRGTVHSGVKVFTMPDGDQLFVHYESIDAVSPIMSGRWTFLGGTGIYEGIAGSGFYIGKEVWGGGAILDVFEGDYELSGIYRSQFRSFIPELVVKDSDVNAQPSRQQLE